MAQWSEMVAVFPYGNLTISIESDKTKDEIAGDLSGLVNRSKDMTPAMRAIGLYFMGTTEKTFKAEGRPKKWTKLAPSTIQDRIRKGFRPGPILTRTGDLRRSLTQRGAQKQIFRVTRNSMTLGSSVPYLSVHQRGTRNVPQRVFIQILSQDVKNVGEIINKYILEGTV
jgi:phage gpG-like protein